MKSKIFWFGVGLFFLVITWPANPFDLTFREVTITAGLSARGTAALLRQQGLIRYSSPLLVIVRLAGWQNRLKAGEYRFSPSEPLPKIIFRLYQGDIVQPKTLTVTFPEGSSIYRQGLILKEVGYPFWQEWQRLTKTALPAAFFQRYTFLAERRTDSLEGYLYPDTYQFYGELLPSALLPKLLDRFSTMILPLWEKRPAGWSLSLHQTLTLASIIEKEAVMPEERALISSVFHNRLKVNMPLAADPTVKYALERPTKRVYYNQLKVDSPYNTYRRQGLPPGPICNPAAPSFQAALYPAKTDFYFFVARKDGSHIFSRTWEEHQRARGRR